MGEFYVAVKEYVAATWWLILIGLAVLWLFRKEIKAVIGYARWLLRQSHVWLIKNLPRGYTVPMTISVGAYFLVFIPAFLYQVYVSPPVPLIVRGDDASAVGFTLLFWLIRLIVIIAVPVMAAAYAVLGLALCNIFAVVVYRLWRRLRPAPSSTLKPVAPTKNSGTEDNPLHDFDRIGIILAGGGAKGAYQAGAMKAVYEFLAEHGALSRVKMIAGTSIGSWNALFWLADLVADAEGQPSPLREWWGSVNVGRLVEPVFYFPLYGNYILSAKPWRDNFEAIFGHGAVRLRLESHLAEPKAENNLHFYLTYTNVEKARQEYTTNNRDAGEVRASARHLEDSLPVDRNSHVATGIEHIGRGVFSSMDLPLTFEYVKVPRPGSENDFDYFEDGGVIDNLPIKFGTEVEGCDLLFVLPLNASFNEPVDKKSLLRRVFRVLDIRQGALERNSFEGIGSYNGRVRSRNRAAAYERVLRKLRDDFVSVSEPVGHDALSLIDSVLAHGDTPKDGEEVSTERRKETRVFAVCPRPELIIKTAEFWKREEAGKAFDLMHDATQRQLEGGGFTDFISHRQGYLAEVSGEGKVSYSKVF